MDNEVLTFGEFLNKLIKEKKITITKLAELTGTKSRTAIERLLNDLTSIKIIDTFAGRLSEVAELNLSTKEIQQLNQAVDISRIGKDRFISRKLLLTLFNQKNENFSNNYEKKCIQFADNIISQKSYLKFNTIYTDINILILGVGFTSFAHNYIKYVKNLSTTINIEQIFSLGKDISKNSKTFITMNRLLNYDNYSSLYLESEENLIDFAVIRKTTTDEIQSTDLLFLYQDNIFLLKDNLDENLYEFYESIFQTMKAQAKPIKYIFTQNNVIDDVLNLCKWHYRMEQNDSECLIKHNVCIPAIPHNVMLNLLKDSNYFELGENHPVIVELVQLFDNRINNFFTSSKRKIHIYTKRGMLNFVETGLTSDHFQFFRPFNKSEIKQTLEFLLEQTEKESTFKMLLLRDNVFLGNIAFSYYKGDALCLYEESSGYGEDYFDVTICAKPFLDLYDDFVENEVLINLVFPESDSIEYLKYLISTLD